MRRLPLAPLLALALAPPALAQNYVPPPLPSEAPAPAETAQVETLPDGSRIVTLSDGTRITVNPPSGSPGRSPGSAPPRSFSFSLHGGTGDWSLPALSSLLAPRSTAPQGPLVRVHLTSDSPGVMLERIRGDETFFGSDDPTVDSQSMGSERPVCSAPCDREVPEKGRYRIAGAGIAPSSEFMLPGDRPDLGLEVNAAPTGQVGCLTAGFTTALTLILTGVPFMFAGGGDPSLMGMQITGDVLTAVGGLAAIGTLVYWIATPSTTSVRTADGQILALDPPILGRWRF